MNTADATVIEAQDKAAMRALVPLITAQLGGGWTWEPGVNSQHMTITRPDGARLYVRYGHGAAARGRITIHAGMTVELSRAHRGGDRLPAMSAALTRTAKAIAADIARKLMPALDEAVKAATSSADQDATAYAARKARVAELHRRFGLNLYGDHSKDRGRATLSRYESGGVSADVELNYRADELTLKLSGPAAQMLAALAAIYEAGA